MSNRLLGRVDARWNAPGGLAPPGRLFQQLWLIIVIVLACTLLPLTAQAATPEFTIHQYFSPGAGAVNTYWIETANEIIVIDGQRTLSEAQAALVSIKATQKPITAIFLTHPHPDHFTGLRVFADYAPEAPIYGSPITLKTIETDANGLVALSRETLGDEFPNQVAVPTELIEEGDILTIAGIEFQIHQLAPNEAAVMTMLYLPETRTLFSGDLVNNSKTPFLLTQHTTAWVAQLESLSSRFPDADLIYPGHGEPGSKDVLIRDQLEYLALFRQLVRDRLADDRQISTDEKAQIVEHMNTWYADYLPVAAIPALLEQNIDAIAAELTSES
ncbi:MBL fold metallo-hydrolase [Almyronema epifaneia]|uniref:MBL fold metallo-hydrolase n=1 Tax=Almyronema epifaneia S1 TaxID=2991925 RepID=A0ABW6ICD1_9CYAN